MKQISKYEVHPAAELFPMMSEAEYEGLKEDIRLHGQNDDVLIWDGMLLDGRNRLRACVELGIEPGWSEIPKTIDPVAWVLSHNLHRRHLTTAQRAMVAEKLATLRLGDNQHGKEGALIKAPSQDDAAEKLNVSRASVQKARKVRSEAKPDVVAAVEAGEMSLNAALATTKPKKEIISDTNSQASIVLDSIGKPIPSSLRSANELAIQLNAVGRELDKYRQAAKDFAEQPGGEWLRLQDIDECVRTLKGHFQGARYHTACPKCGGQGAGCKKCDGAGWIPDYLKATIS